MQTFTLICSIIAALAGITAVLTFIFARQKDSVSKIEADVTLKNDLKYLRDNVDEVRVDLKELSRQTALQNEKLSKDDVRIKQLEVRQDTIERRLEIIEKRVK